MKHFKLCKNKSVLHTNTDHVMKRRNKKHLPSGCTYLGVGGTVAPQCRVGIAYTASTIGRWRDELKKWKRGTEEERGKASTPLPFPFPFALSTQAGWGRSRYPITPNCPSWNSCSDLLFV